ncbi:MAG: nucleoside-diphosphate sugar epimerase, partial [Qipengyuania citrea]
MSDAVRIGLIGATGLIGAGVMAQCVGREDVRLTGIARRETQLPRGIRMELFVADPANWGDVIEAVRPTAIICALGTT